MSSEDINKKIAERFRNTVNEEKLKKKARIQADKELKEHTQPPELLVRCMTEVKDEPLRTEFGGRLIYGNFHLMVGPGQAGKGMVSVDMLARLSTGEPFPGEGNKWRDPINCFVCVTEDSAARFKARLVAAGANIKQIFCVDGPPQRIGGLTLPSPVAFSDDAGSLLKQIQDRNIGALFLETTLEHLGSRDGKNWSTNNEAEVRRVLSPITAVCREAMILAWGVMHPRKSLDGGVENSISGSVAFNNVARGTMFVYRDPMDDAPSPARLLFCKKANYLKENPPTLVSHIEPWDKDHREGRTVWGIEGRTLEDLRTAEDVFDQLKQKYKTKKPRRDKRVEEAEEFLRRILANGRVLQPEIKAAAKAEDISWDSVKSAKSNLRVESVRESDPSIPGGPPNIVFWEFNAENKDF